jgi:hypothetical protein
MNFDFRLRKYMEEKEGGEEGSLVSNARNGAMHE